MSLHWIYAAEVKVWASTAGGNFEEAFGGCKTSLHEPSFENMMFAGPLSATTIKVLMRGMTPWAKAAALAGPWAARAGRARGL